VNPPWYALHIDGLSREEIAVIRRLLSIGVCVVALALPASALAQAQTPAPPGGPTKVKPGPDGVPHQGPRTKTPGVKVGPGKGGPPPGEIKVKPKKG
jgi:hypothetical protein